MQTNSATATVERPVILPQAGRRREDFGSRVVRGALVTLVVTKAWFFTSALSYV
jgi:hypothetical protein